MEAFDTTFEFKARPKKLSTRQRVVAAALVAGAALVGTAPPALAAGTNAGIDACVLGGPSTNATIISGCSSGCSSACSAACCCWQPPRLPR